MNLWSLQLRRTTTASVIDGQIIRQENQLIVKVASCWRSTSAGLYDEQRPLSRGARRGAVGRDGGRAQSVDRRRGRARSVPWGIRGTHARGRAGEARRRLVVATAERIETTQLGLAHQPARTGSAERLHDGVRRTRSATIRTAVLEGHGQFSVHLNATGASNC